VCSPKFRHEFQVKICDAIVRALTLKVHRVSVLVAMQKKNGQHRKTQNIQVMGDVIVG
jgi:hypothetical protein